MNPNHSIVKRITIYIISLFILGLGVTFFISANLGVPPIASLPYSITLITGISIGITTVIAHFCFILIQIILLKRIKILSIITQLAITVLFGFFIDLTGWLLTFLPAANSYGLRGLYLIIGILSSSIAILLYFMADLPMMPYDTLTRTVVDKFHLHFGKFRVISDITVVLTSLTICLILLNTFGAIGIGTVIAAYSIGKISGIILLRFQPIIKNWIYPSSKVVNDLEEHSLH